MDIFENNVIRYGERKFVCRGWVWMVYGFFYKLFKILFDWLEIFILFCEVFKCGCDWLFWVVNYCGNY